MKQGRRWFCRAALAAGAALAAIGAESAEMSLHRVFGRHVPDSEIRIDHSFFARFLETYLQEAPDGINRLSYSRVTATDHRLLKAYIASLEAADVAALSRQEQFAFWANLYNAVTIDVVLDAWPVDSILDIRPTWFSLGPWRKTRVTVGGRALSLHNIEHDILRAIWRDPRVHYAVNCASVGCPNLHKRPFEREDLNIRLNAYAREYVNHPRGATFDKRGRLVVSKIYKWFREDFRGTDQGVIDHLKQHANAPFQARLEDTTGIGGYRYDWSLNAPPQEGGG